MRWWILAIAIVALLALAPTASEQYGAASWRILKTLLTTLDCDPGGTCDLAAGTTIGGVAIETASGGGSPSAADYLTGTTQAGITGEIVVGATPGGELGNTWASPTVDNGLSVDSWTLNDTTLTGATEVVDDASFLARLDLLDWINTETVTYLSPHAARNDWTTWFNIDGQAEPVEGEGGHVGGVNDVTIKKTTAIMEEKTAISLTETETYLSFSTLILGGDGDGVGNGVYTYCTGGSHAQGNEGCQGFRSRVSDVWLTAFGTFSASISSGAGTQTAALTVGTVTEAESKVLGENKLIVFTDASLIKDANIVDAPPGTINAGALEDPGTAWSFDGAASGQGVFTLGSGEVTSTGVKANSWCLSPVDSNYTDINGQSSRLWLLIDQINSGTDTVRTRWENQGYNGRTPYPLLVGEGAGGAAEAKLAPCAVLGPPTFNAGDQVADSLTLVKGADFPAISSGSTSAFEVSAYPGITENSFRGLMSNRLGFMYAPAGFISSNQLDGGSQSGRFQLGYAFDADVTGSPSNLDDGTFHGWKGGVGCEVAGECKSGIDYTYASDPAPVSIDQWLALIDFPSADWADDVARIIFRVSDDSTKNLTLDKTDGWGANGDAFRRASQFTSGTATPTDGSTACNTNDQYTETDAHILWICTDGATDDWWGTTLVD